MRLRHWDREEGLPQSSAAAMAQTPDGYLWVATYSGLARFDGRRFVTFQEPGSPVKNLGKTAMLVSRVGELLVTNLNGDVFAYRNGKFARIGSFPGQTFERMVEDGGGELWLIDDHLALVRARDGWRIPLREAGQSAIRMAVAVADPGSRRLWVLRDREFGYVEDGRLTLADLPAGSTVRGMGAARERGFWLVLTDRLERWVDGRPVETIATGAWPEGEKTSIVAETAAGQVAVGTSEHGLFLFDRTGRRTHIGPDEGLADAWVMSLLVDREGSLWIGLANHGLNALQEITFSTIAPPDDWGRRALTNTLVDGEALLVGTEGRGIYRWQAGAWERLFTKESGVSGYVWTMRRDGAGSLWFGTWGTGAYEDRDGVIVPHPEVEAPYQKPAAFLKARDGSFWIASEQGLFHRQAGRVTCYTEAHGIPRAVIRCLAEGADGAIWFGTRGEGLGRFFEGKTQMFRRPDGLPDDQVTGLHVDEKGGVWIGTFESGLTRFFGGGFVHLDAKDGLEVNHVGSILDDGRDSWWLTTRDGIVRVKKTALLRRAAGEPIPLEVRRFTTEDGLPSLECSGSPAMTADGRLFFPTRGGLAAVRPDDVVINRVAPTVLIESLSVDGRPVSFGAGRRIVLPPGSERCMFSFTAPSFIAPHGAAFRFKLEGVDRAWIDATADRTATYSFLPPGDYVFSVLGSNGHGVWSAAPATVELKILPFFWQTWWFQTGGYAAAAALLGGLGVWVSRRRWSRRLEALERKQALERERARIAKDIHDDLGAGLIRISLLSQSAQRDLAGTNEHLLAIGKTAREMTRAMDEIVWAVNPSHDSLDGIATYVAAYAQEFLRSVGIACRWDFPLDLPPWPVSAEIRHNLFLAIKEALTNVAKHARATRVDLTLATRADGFEFAVTDDGVGGVQTGDAPSATPGGNGLRNMRTRLQEIGGACAIRSTPGGGTAICFTIPLKSLPSPADGPAGPEKAAS